MIHPPDYRLTGDPQDDRDFLCAACGEAGVSYPDDLCPECAQEEAEERRFETDTNR